MLKKQKSKISRVRDGVQKELHKLAGQTRHATQNLRSLVHHHHFFSLKFAGPNM